MTPRVISLDDLCIHQVCLSGTCDFASSVGVLADAQIKRTAIWNPMVEAAGEAEALSIWKDSGLVADSLCAAELGAGSDHLRAMLDRADSFDARTVVMITGGFGPNAAAGCDWQTIDDARAELVDRLAEADALARPYNTRIAFEPLHPMVCGLRSCVSSLGEALDVLGRLDETHQIGLAVDAYALWSEQNIADRLMQAGPLIRNFHISDWLPDTRDLRLDRGMPGDGLIDLRGWRRMVEASGYRGPVEVEIFSAHHWWQTAPDVMVQTIIDRMNNTY